ncbi:unnamed protein product [Didymodactylos carnosus]|uniref:Uncharacterized protein n=1 Tax=Didymodactylos carnosus TaxID=1234261 RepID=A0A814IQV6_9BILA|nr:unnamed protein product [Didymodactylos carnosus]CAF1027731.1 unnamed protein product [Didymodactylos carnosus]CAF3614760.1 unnamed protein product [Didymodactylos carnosus]CAF3798783.1 unnamed protein product [Didymodactylos carnosus]
MGHMGITLMEDQPNEVFLEYFQYLSVIDLHLGFYNLNSRIDSILYSFRITVDLRSTTEAYYNLITQTIFPLFYQQILHLYLRSQDIEIEQFQNLRLLEICHPSNAQTNVIRPEIFPYLHTLVIHHLSSKKIDKICQLVLENGFCQLRNCRLPYIEYAKLPIHCQLHELMLNRCTKTMLSVLLTNLSKLKSLNVEIHPDDSKSAFLIEKNVTGLTGLALNSNQCMSFDELEHLLAHTLNLKSLAFSTKNQQEYLDFGRWKFILSNFTPHLLKFHYDLLINRYPCKISETTDIDRIQNMHWLFQNVTYTEHRSYESYSWAYDFHLYTAKKNINWTIN